MVFACPAEVTLQGRESSNGSFPTASRFRSPGPWAAKGVAVQSCKHLNEIKPVTPHTKGCEECLKMGDSWVHLRLCLECGHVGCCDSSKNKHATKHFHRSKHPIMKSLEPGENWGWCYVDEIELDFPESRSTGTS
jgi:uncharacterized UBP type Zn finger protein